MQNIVEVLKKAKTIAIVGASPDPARPSHYISRYFMDQGYTVIPVNPRSEEHTSELQSH